MSMYDERLKEWYNGAKEYLDENFLSQLDIEEHRISKESELILAHELLSRKYSFKKRLKNGGPDFLLEYEGKKIWIEVVAPKEGDYPVLKNKVVSDNGGVSGVVDDKNCKIKISSALYDKTTKQYLDWIKKGIVKNNDVKVICINVCNLNDGPEYCPNVASVLYGIQRTFYVDDKALYGEWEAHPPIQKPTSGTALEMGLFKQPDYKIVDGVLWFDYRLGRYGDCDIQFLANYNRKKLIGNLFSDLSQCVIPPDEGE
jgi:hypothetical protein